MISPNVPKPQCRSCPRCVDDSDFVHCYACIDIERSVGFYPDFIKSACTSYSKHFGPRAVEAAEQDKLGEALELLRRATGHIDRAGWPFGLHEAIVSFLATTTKEKPARSQ